MTDSARAALAELVTHVAQWERAGIDTTALSAARAALAQPEAAAGELPPLPEPSITSHQTDSTMRTMVVLSFSDQQMHDYARAALAARPSEPDTVDETTAMQGGRWISYDSIRDNLRALDKALNGTSAKSPLLIDILMQVQAEASRIGRPLLAARPSEPSAPVAAAEGQHPLDAMLPDICQLIDSVKAEWQSQGCWSERDQSVRQRIADYNTSNATRPAEEARPGDEAQTVIHDLLWAKVARSSCQAGMVARCRCWDCSAGRARKLLAAPPAAAPVSEAVLLAEELFNELSFRHIKYSFLHSDDCKAFGRAVERASLDLNRGKG